jgi:type II secretory pathway predicted ATPase ExeA
MSSQCELRQRLADAGMTGAEFARAAGLSRTAAHRLLQAGVWPVRDADAPARVERVLNHRTTAAYRREVLERLGRALPPPGGDFEAGTDGSNRPSPDTTPADEGGSRSIEEQLMLIQKCSLTPAAREYWGVPPGALHAPWRREDVFLGGDMRVIYEHMLAKARFGGLLAIIGESGSGKTTIKDTLVTDLAESGEVVVIEPHTQRMEETDKKGKTLKGGDLVEAILREVAPGERLRQTAEAQLNQVAACLADSLAEHRERRHLLIIDEAHCLPKPTLRHLKRFLEMKNPRIKGLQRPMLSILLLGQPELATRLSPQDPSVREVWQRCEVAHLPPLVRALPEYLTHRLGKAAAVFTPDAQVKLAEILTARDGRSFVYPLAIDSWVAEILNASVGLGKSITAQHVEEARRLVKCRNGIVASTLAKADAQVIGGI